MSRGNGAARLAFRALFLLALSTQAWAHDDSQANAAWYNSLALPNGMHCCGEADANAVDYWVSGDHYEAFYKGAWVAIPPEKVLQRTDNPTGQGVLFTSPASGAIYCFVAASEG